MHIFLFPSSSEIQVWQKISKKTGVHSISSQGCPESGGDTSPSPQRTGAARQIHASTHRALSICRAWQVSPSRGSGSQIKVLDCCLVGFLEDVCSGAHLEGQAHPDGCEQGLQGGDGRNQDGGPTPLLSVTPEGALGVVRAGKQQFRGPPGDLGVSWGSVKIEKPLIHQQVKAFSFFQGCSLLMLCSAGPGEVAA